MLSLAASLITAVAASAFAQTSAGQGLPLRPPATPYDNRPEPRYVATHTMVLTYSVQNGVAVEGVDLWVSLDRGHTWKPAEAQGKRPEALTWAAPADGEYDLFMVLRNAAGSSSDPPAPGTPAHLSVVVDTVPPMLQIHAAQVRSLAGLHRSLHIDATLVDEHLSDSGARLFFRRSQTDRWSDGGVLTFNGRSALWELPEHLPSTFDIRVVATDRAGNASADEFAGVKTIEVYPTTRPSSADSPASSDRTSAFADDAQNLAEQPGRTGGLEHVAHVSVEPVERTPLEAPPETPPDKPVAPERDRRTRRLRQAASQHMDAGRYALAAARLEDALELSPDDPDLLSALGGASYRHRRFEDAERQYRAALGLNADHLEAVEGLALLDATLRRYPQARERSRQLLKLKPESAKIWLFLGDVEHKLGNLQPALDAWHRSLKVSDTNARMIKEAKRRLDYFDTLPKRPKRR